MMDHPYFVVSPIGASKQVREGNQHNLFPRQEFALPDTENKTVSNNLAGDLIKLYLL